MRKRLAQHRQAVVETAKNRPVIILIIAGVFAAAGLVFLLRTNAATGTQKFEAEAGQPMGGKVSGGTESGVSGQSYMRLNSDNGIPDLLSLDEWTYIHADGSRTNPNYLWGLGMGDVDGDGYNDIVSGPYLYLNKGTGDITGTWSRQSVFSDANLVIDADGDEFGDVIDLGGQATWLEWDGDNMVTRGNGGGPGAQQGSASGEILGGGPPEVVYTSSGGGVHIITFNGSSMSVSQIGSGAGDEGVAIGDFNADGKPDVTANDGNNAIWFENNGTTSGWARHVVGTADNGEAGGGWTDKMAAADIDKDGKTDILLSEEVFDGGPANTYWWKNPGTAGVNSAWPQRTTIASQDTTNSMSVADMDNDGDIDVVTGEHRGDKEAVVWENNGTGLQWTKHLISSGHENHGGTKLSDLDNDGDLDVVSIAYDAPQDLHIYRNDAIN